MYIFHLFLPPLTPPTLPNTGALLCFGLGPVDFDSSQPFCFSAIPAAGLELRPGPVGGVKKANELRGRSVGRCSSFFLAKWSGFHWFSFLYFCPAKRECFSLPYLEPCYPVSDLRMLIGLELLELLELYLSYLSCIHSVYRLRGSFVCDAFRIQLYLVRHGRLQ